MTATISGPTLEYYLANFFEGNVLKAMICTNGFTLDKDTHTWVTSVTNEVTGTGYTAGGVSLTGVDVAIYTATDEVKLLADDAEFGIINVTNAAQIIVYTLGTTTVSGRIISAHTFTPLDISQEFTFAWPPDGSGKGVIGVFPY